MNLGTRYGFSIILSYCLFIMLLSLLVYVVNSSSDNYYFYIYGSPYCPHCHALYRFLNKTYGDNHVYFCDIIHSNTCITLFRDFVDIGLTEGVPTTFIIYNNTVSAILIGEYRGREFFDQCLRMNTDNKIPVYYADFPEPKLYGYLVINVSHQDFISKYLCMKPYCIGGNTSLAIHMDFIPFTENNHTPSIIDVLPMLFLLGFLDSINPCTMTLYFSFIIMCLSGRRSIGPPIVFLLIIYFGYLLLGYILVVVSSIVPPQIFILLALLAGIYNVIHAGKRGVYSFKCVWCEKIGFMNRVMGNKYFLAIILSLFSVFILLPCTAGPLTVFISILHSYPWYVKIPSLILYNLIFISLLIAIFVTTYYFGKEKRIAKWLKNNSDTIEFLTGFILILIAITLLLAKI